MTRNGTRYSGRKGRGRKPVMRSREQKLLKSRTRRKTGTSSFSLVRRNSPLPSKIAQQKTFTWEGLNYHVPSPNGPLRLLHDVYGYVKPGTLTALMGASGAGMSCVHQLRIRYSQDRQAKPPASMFWPNAKTLELFQEMFSWMVDPSILTSPVEQPMVRTFFIWINSCC